MSGTIKHLLVRGDSRRLLRVGDERVHLVVTSPPYWQLKDYGEQAQIGFHDTYEEYINHLNLVWQECARVLVPGGRLCINVGDQFARASFYGRYKVIPIRTEIIRFCETVGLDHMGAIIWQKVTTCNTSGGASIMGSFPYPPNGIIKLDYEFILLFRKPGRRAPVEAARKKASRLTTEQWKRYFAGHWNFPGVRQKQHLAAFPAELPRRLVRMFSFVGDTVLDPFLGSGTTCLVCAEENRNSIGYEISAEFIVLAKERLAAAESLFQSVQPVVAEDPLPAAVPLKRLPYRFRDPVRMDRPRGVSLDSHGSRINGQEAPHPESWKVMAVIAHDRLKLDDGRQIGLLGVGTPRYSAPRAVARLEELCLGQRVRLSADAGCEPPLEGFFYVHLRNRKFINAHLIKSGLVEADQSRSYRHRLRFERYARDSRAAWEGGEI